MLCAGAEVDHRLESEYREETHSAPSGVWSAGRLQEEVLACLIFRSVVSRGFEGFLLITSLYACVFQWSCSQSDGGVTRQLHRRQCFTSSSGCTQVWLSLVSSLSFDMLLSFLMIYTYPLLFQVHRSGPERPKHLSVRSSPGFETSAFSGGRTHPRCKKIHFLNECILYLKIFSNCLDKTPCSPSSSWPSSSVQSLLLM